MTRSGRDLVRAFYDAYSDQAPERVAAIVAKDYVDYGHEPPVRGAKSARNDFDHAPKMVGAIRYEIAALVDDGDGRVAAGRTAHLRGTEFKGLGLYRVHGHLLAETPNAVVGPLPKQLRS
jgi:ketosteroid isomerase-like protein